MTQRYNLYNKTKKVLISHVNKSWKYREWEWIDIMKIMKWEKTDEIFAIGDKGDLIAFVNGEEKNMELKDESLGEKEIQHKYVWGEWVFNRDITQEEWTTFLKTGTCKLITERLSSSISA